MITVTLTPQQFLYLQRAVTRDCTDLEDMAPWEIDDAAIYEEEQRRCEEVMRVLAKVEQEQVLKH